MLPEMSNSGGLPGKAGGTPTYVRRHPIDVIPAVLRKFDTLQAARALIDLSAVPTIRLEALKGALKDLYSIRVNDQWRLVFRWDGSNAHDVRLTDFH